MIGPGAIGALQWARTVAPSALDAHDNLPAACKPVVDEIAAWLGLASDADPRVTWIYAQQRGGPRQYGVRITLEVSPCGLGSRQGEEV